MIESETTLGARLQARDPAALAMLFEHEGRRALGLAYRVLGDRAAAEDAVQEAFAQLWQRAGSLDRRDGRVESLLMTMVHRRSVDLLRARLRRERRAWQGSMPPVADPQAGQGFDRVLDDLSSERRRARLRDALQALPAEQRLVVERAYFEGLTLREIAEQGAMPLGTVKSRLRLAMEKLTEAMRSRALHD